MDFKKLILFVFIFCFGCTDEIETDKYEPKTEVFTGSNLAFFNAVNEMRLHRNIAPLKGEKLLTVGCNRHATYMFSSDTLTHDYFWSRYVNSKSKSFGEIVCYGYFTSESQISAYANSQSHNSVLIDKKYTHIGIANNGLYQCVDLANYK